MTNQYTYHFLLLRSAFKHIPNGTSIEISINELSNVLFCTNRNVKIILNKLMQHGLLSFKPGKGRGNLSVLSFSMDFEDFLHEQVQFLLKEGHLNKALELVREYGNQSKAESYFLEWIRNYFGYYSIVSNEDQETEILRFPIFRPVTTLDPAYAFFDFDAHIMLQIYNALVDYDPNTERFKGSLAHAWETNPSKTKWVFYLRKGVLFHHDQELTSHHVKKSFLRLKDSPHSWLLRDLKEIEIVSKYCLVITFHRPQHLFLHFVSYVPMSIVEIEGTNLFGTGPYKISTFTEDYLELSIFEKHFQHLPHIHRIEIWRMETRWLEHEVMEGQKIHVDTGESKNKGLESWSKAEIYSGTTVLSVNTVKEGPLQNVKLRRMMDLLIDRAKMVQELGYPRICPSIQFHFSDGYAMKKSVAIDKVDQNQTDYKGEKITLYTYRRHELDAQWLKTHLQSYQIQLEVKVVELHEIKKKEMIEQADLILFEATPHEGIISLLDLYLYKEGFIYPLLHDEMKKKLDTRMRDITADSNPVSRQDKLNEVEEYLKKEGMLLFLTHKEIEVSYDTFLNGVEFNARKWIDFKKLWYKPPQIQDILSED